MITPRGPHAFFTKRHIIDDDTMRAGGRASWHSLGLTTGRAEI